MNFTLLILGGGALLLLGVFKWRQALMGVMLLVIFEGAIRKWILPQASQVVYFAKDFLLLGAYGGYFFGETRKPRATFDEGLMLLLGLCSLWTFMESFNSGTGSVVAGLFGWRAYVLYMPICFMVPALFETEAELEKFLRYYLIIALPVSVLGVAQFYAPQDSPLNVYAASVTDTPEAFINVFGEDMYVRVTGTFSYISGYSGYLVAVIAMLVPVLAWNRSKLWIGLLGCTLALVIGNCMMTGSRSTALGAAIVLTGFALLTLMIGSDGERRRAWVHWLAGAAAVIAAVWLFGAALRALEERTADAWEEGQHRLWGALFEPWQFMGSVGVFGHGNGITQSGVSALRSALHLPPPAVEFASPTDSESTRVLGELGVPGFFLWYTLRVWLIVALWGARQRLESPFLRQLALGAFLLFIYLMTAVTMFSPTANIFHWFLVGFILLLPKLDTGTQPELALAPAEGRRKRSRQRRGKSRSRGPWAVASPRQDHAPHIAQEK